MQPCVLTVPGESHKWWRLWAGGNEGACAVDPATQQLLEVSVGLMQHLQVTTKELAALCHVAIPNPASEAQKLMPSMTAGDDVEASLDTFERTATLEGWPHCNWARLMIPLLSGEAQQLQHAMPAAAAEDYDALRAEILARWTFHQSCRLCLPPVELSAELGAQVTNLLRAA